VTSQSTMSGATPRERRGRSGSLVEVKEVATDEQDLLDQNAYNNPNPEWVNAKGAVSPPTFHVV